LSRRPSPPFSLARPRSERPRILKAPRAPPKATAVFISGLPFSTTLTQLSSVFSKAGLILEDGDGNPKIKMYKNEQGHFKGEALVVYLQEASVELAIRLLDETELELGSGEGVMHVKKAEFDQRSQVEGSKGKEKADGAPKDSKKSELEKQKAGKRAEKLKQCVLTPCPFPFRLSSLTAFSSHRKLTDWSSDEEDATAAAKAKAKFSKLVVLQGMFTLQELEEDATLLLDLKEDVRDECETMGEVTNVTLYDVSCSPRSLACDQVADSFPPLVEGGNGHHHGSVQGRYRRASLHRRRFPFAVGPPSCSDPLSPRRK
jgi:HIV Tat-specific factor 1